MHARYKNCSFWKCELKPSEHACKIFFKYSKLCAINFFAKKVQLLPPKHDSRCFSNEFSQHYWQESLDGDSFASQSGFDAYAISAGQPTASRTLVNYCHYFRKATSDTQKFSEVTPLTLLLLHFPPLGCDGK